MKHTLSILFLLFFSQISQSQVTINVTELINNYKIEIIWIPTENLEDTFENKKLIGRAIIKFEDVNSKRVFYTSNSSIHISKKIEGITFDNENNVLCFSPITINLSANEIDFITFKDIDFDNNKELIITQTVFLGNDNNAFKFYSLNKEKNILEEFLNLPDPIRYLRNIDFDYKNKEIISKEYYTSSTWYTYYYKLYGKRNFIEYKSENHNVDTSSNIDTIIIKEVGKNEIKITKKIK